MAIPVMILAGVSLVLGFAEHPLEHFLMHTIHIPEQLSAYSGPALHLAAHIAAGGARHAHESGSPFF